MSISDQDLQEFKCEALELIDVAEKSLLAIDSGADFKITFDAVFRCFHNLKGAAGMMELLQLQSHTHELETTLLTFKEAPTIPKQYVTHFLNGLDGARALLDGKTIAPLAAPQVPSLVPSQAPSLAAASVSASPLVDEATAEFYGECDEIIERVAHYLKQIESSTHTKETIDALYRDFHSLKGSAYLFTFNHLGEIAHLVETSLEPIRDGAQAPTQALIDGVFRALKLIESEIRFLKIGQKSDQNQEKLNDLTAALVASSTPAPTPPQEDQTSSLLAELTKSNLKEISRPTLAPIAVTRAPAPLAPVTAVAQAPDGLSTVVANKEKESENSSIRVSVNLLDNLMTLIGEMVLVRNQVIQFANTSEDQEFCNLSKRLSAVTSEIQDGMMKTRMQPIGNVLNKFSRVARDLSQELGKSITVTLSGSETELDKSLLEAIKDPLTHIVRNSCDHGIETPAVRTQAGKSETGTIAIKSFHEGGQVVIEVRDDGKGLDRDVLLKKGVEKGLITEAQTKSMTEREIFALIFAPGFSTAQKVTNVSGRGVGMDVVRTNIEKIGGTVDLISTRGKGTTIVIKIPLTLAIIPALIVNCGESIFAIPQVKLSELVRVDQNSVESKIEYLQGMPVYRLRGDILPLVDLNKILGFSTSNASPFTNIAVLNANGRSFGLIVDEIRDTADIVVKPLNRLLKSLQIYSGATILGDGSVALILDVLGLSKLAQIGRDDQASNQAENARLAAQKHARSENQDYILFKVNSPTKHAVVLGYVHRLEEFKKSDIEYIGDKKVIRYRNSLLHIVTANKHLGYTSNESEPRDIIPIIVIDRAGALFGIEVDEILDTLSSDIDPRANLVKQTGIFGNLNTKSELILVVDPFELISNAFGEAEKKAVAAPKMDTIEKLRILLAEDTVFFRKAITAVLSKVGHEVIHANDGKEALDLFDKREGYFDLILSDIEMPRMNGFDFARSVRTGKNNPKIPMVAVSSRADSSYINRGMEAGFNFYMEKLKPDLLLQTINDLMSDVRKKAS